nr:NADH dehydrogenase subunit 3 [Uniformus sp.]
MNLTFIFLFSVILITLLISMLILLIGKKMIIDLQKSSPFECGFNPMTLKRLPFSMHFFLIAMVFLIFDVEIIIILPMILTLKSSLISSWLMISILFVLIITLGLYLEWISGMLNWTK